jgi:hypothetical protein
MTFDIGDLLGERGRELHLQRDEDFADWFVDELMETTDLKDYKYKQDPEVLKWAVINARGYARHFRIAETEAQVEFVALMYTLGPCFFTYPGFREIATDPALTGKEKMEAFYAIDEELAVDVLVANDRSCWWEAELPPMREE